MKNYLFILLMITCILINKSFGQVNYVEGFVITNELDTIQGFIDYQQWDENPTQIAFKKRQSGEVTYYYPLQIHAFYVAGDYYESKRVSINKASLKLNQLSYSPVINFEIEPSFVISLIKGVISLYYLKDQNARVHYFIQKDTSQLETLIYHKYFDTINERKIAVEIHEYKKQLLQYLYECPAIQAKVNGAKYYKTALHKLIVQYHECVAEQYQNYVKPYPPEQLHQFSTVAGISYSSLYFDRKNNDDVIDEMKFNRSLKPSFGFTYSYFIPRQRQKIAFYNELLYRSYNVQGKYYNAINKTIIFIIWSLKCITFSCQT